MVGCHCVLYAAPAHAPVASAPTPQAAPRRHVGAGRGMDRARPMPKQRHSPRTSNITEAAMEHQATPGQPCRPLHGLLLCISPSDRPGRTPTPGTGPDMERGAGGGATSFPIIQAPPSPPPRLAHTDQRGK